MVLKGTEQIARWARSLQLAGAFVEALASCGDACTVGARHVEVFQGVVSRQESGEILVVVWSGTSIGNVAPQCSLFGIVCICFKHFLVECVGCVDLRL